MTDDPPKIRYKPTPLLKPNARTYKRMLEYGAFRLAQ